MASDSADEVIRQLRSDPPVAGLVIIPHDGDPTGLLAKGACSLSAPAVCSRVEERWRSGPVFGSKYRGLPLWWDGALVSEAFYRATFVLASSPHTSPGAREHGKVLAYPNFAEAERLAELFVRIRFADSVVRLYKDSDGAFYELSTGPVLGLGFP